MLRPGTTPVANDRCGHVRSRLGGLGVRGPIDDARRRTGRPSRRPRAVASAVLIALGAVTVAGGVAPHAAGADIVLPTPIGPIEVPLPLPDPVPPDPTTTTTLPDPTTTTTVPDPTTTTTVPDPTTTTTTRATTTTTSTRRTTTTTRARRSTTTTVVGRSGNALAAGGQSSGPPRPGATSGARRGASPNARTRAGAASRFQPPASSGPHNEAVGPAAAGASTSPIVPNRLRSALSPAAELAPGRAHGFDASALAGILLAGVTALVLALAQRDASRQRRSEATLVAPGTLRLGRDESEAGVREQLRSMLVGGGLTVTGSDCRSLQLLVQAAAHEGLEIRDPRGHIVRATNRLVRAYGVEPDRKRLPLRWAVGVGRPTVQVPEGYEYVLTRTGPHDEGRLLAFTPGTEMMLWSGDCL